MNIDKFLLFDGAMGTYYSAKNRPYTHSQANLLDYNTIVSIHREYIAGGAMAITTNTFGIEDLQSIRAAYSAAIDASRGTDTLVFSSIGPINGYEADNYKVIIDTLIEIGAKNFIFETFPSEEIIIELSNYIKIKLPDSFIIASFAVDQNGYSAYGKFFINIVNKVKVIPSIDAYGFNCVCGPVHMKEIASKLDTSAILSIMPNAGYPSFIDDKPVYTDNPEYFAAKLLEIYQFGVKILGGCCGTTPRHIEAARRLLNQSTNSAIESPKEPVNIPVIRKKNEFKDKLINSSSKVILVEYDAPLSSTGNDISNAALLLEKSGIDGITIADNPLGRARADSLIVAVRIMRDTKNITVIPHITCRDRNAISIRSALMGLNVEEINNILCITGDPVPSCNINKEKGVFSFNSYSLLSYVEALNNELSYGNFYEGAALNVNANHYHIELERASKKLASGAKYFITQPCFSEKSINNTMLASEMLKVPVIAGIMPIKSFRNASFIKSEISGIDIPDDVVELYRDKNPAECEEITVKFTINLIKKLYDYVRGFHIITPPKGEGLVARLVKEIKSL